jgi:probable HAF family extracellular repeat protein
VLRLAKRVALQIVVGFHMTVASGQLYSVTDLGACTDNGGQSLSGPRAINRAGQLAGINVIGGSYRGLVNGGSWTNLGTLGGTDSYAAGINSSQRVVGYSFNASGLDHAFLWTPGGTGGVTGNVQMKDLGTLGGNSSEAYAINQAGQITGYAQNTQNDRAFISSGGTMTDIGALLGSSLPNSYGYSINDLGHIAGTAYNSKFAAAHAFFYNGATAVDIGSLGQGASGSAINNNDQITGYSTTSASVDHAFRYAGGGLTDLGTLGGHWSYGNAINNSNVIVGGSFIDTADSVYHAFVTVGNSLTDLNTNVNSSGTGWVLVEARGINDAGQIVGVGTLGGVNHGFLVSPAPQITRQPTNVTVACQGSASFSVTATPLPLSYQWYKGNPSSGAQISNATNNVLTLTGVTGAQTGPYYVVVRGAVASVTSSAALLTVLDSTPPVITGCPGNITNVADQGLCSSVVTWTNPTAMDACDGAVAVSCLPTNGSRFSKGVTLVTCSSRDASGNSNSCSFMVTVLDKQAPTIVGCPGNMTNYTVPGVTSAAVSWTTPTAMDNCDGSVPVVCTPLSGSVFTQGVTTVTCKANDSSGNTNSCSFTVTLLQAQNPAITDLKVAGTNVVIRFVSMNAGHYSVQATDSPTASWTDVLTGIPGTGGTITATNTGGATFLPRFFRVKLSLP